MIDSEISFKVTSQLLSPAKKQVWSKARIFLGEISSILLTVLIYIPFKSLKVTTFSHQRSVISAISFHVQNVLKEY